MNRTMLNIRDIIFRRRLHLNYLTRRWKHSTSMPLRDFLEKMNRPYMMRRDNFFSKHNDGYHMADSFENLIDYDPILTQCIARWLWLNYKITDYPYYNLNIFNIFTDLPQAIFFLEKIMMYFQKILPPESFDRIDYYLLPLYPCHNIDKTKFLKNIQGKVHILDDPILFPGHGPLNVNSQNGLYITDPVQVLILDDVLPKLSHDLVRYCPYDNSWEQCYMEENTNSKEKTKNFTSSLDFWCKRTLNQLYDINENNSLTVSTNNDINEIYIPTQFMQLLDQLKMCVPDFRLFTIDSPKRDKLTLSMKLRQLLGYKITGSSELLEPFPGSIWTNEVESERLNKINGGLRFKPDFAQIEKVFNTSNENDAKLFPPCEIEAMGDFCNKWVDGKIKHTTSQHNNLPKEFLDKLKIQLQVANKSTLSILHS